jgi:hypothetical protein
LSSRDIDGSISAPRFVFPHATDDAVGEVSLVGSASLASCLAFGEFAVDESASVVDVTMLNDAERCS